MSEDFDKSLAKLKEIFHQLYYGEPSPDEEEEAQKEMLKLFNDLIRQCEDTETKPIFEKTLEIIKNWDTLDKWFKEVPELVENIKKILKLYGNDTEINEGEPIEEDGSSSLTENENLILGKEIAEAIAAATKNLPTGVDISLIIKTVTEQVTKSFMEKRGKDKKIEEKPQLEKILIEAKKIGQIKALSNKKSEKASSTSENKAEIKKEKKGISKADIMKSLLETTTKRIKSLAEIQTEKSTSASAKASKPKSTESTSQKISITPVIKPLKKIKSGFEDKNSNEEILESTEKKNDIRLTSGNESENNKETHLENQKSPELSKIQPIRRIKISNINTQKPEEISIPDVKNENPNVKHNTSVPKIIKPKLSIKASTIDSEQKPSIKSISSNIPVIKPSNIPTKTTQENLFNTFTKRANPIQNNTQIKDTTTNNTINSGNQGFSIPNINGKDDFGFVSNEPNIAPLSKDKLYQELIALEGRKYAIERGRKEMRTRHERGQIQDVEYKTAIERFKYELENISGKINDIRQKIQAL